MAVRFLLRIPRSGSHPSQAFKAETAVSGFHLVFDSDRVQAFTNAATNTVLLPDGAGLLLGHVFRKASSDKPVAFSDPEVTRLVQSKGDALFDMVWGGYVAVVCDPAGSAVYVLRDPSGQMPCFFAHTQDEVWIASDVDVLFLARLPVPDIDWPYLTQHLRFSDLPSQHTGLKGIEELMAGFRLSVTARHTSADPAWSPWNYAGASPGIRPNDAVSALRDAVSTCLHTWANAFDHILLGVSGGLDSSIVAACLAESHASVTAFTLATAEAEGDERHYARALTQGLGLPLAEAFHHHDRVDVTKPTNPHLPRPGAPAFGQSGIGTMLDLAADHHVDAFFTGIGGDNVFCFTQSATPLVDRVKADGIGAGAWATLNDICRLTDCSYWEALGAAMRKAAQLRRPVQWSGFDWTGLLTPDLNSAALSSPHPWLDVPSSALPGKIAHVSGLVRIQGTLDTFSREDVAPQIHPLLSQPIVELCLQIPTWEWIAHGRNRSVARRAFDQQLPTMITRRRSKGGPTHFACAVVERRLPALREHLMEGVLHKQGLLDMEGLGPLLMGHRPIQAPDHIRISILAEAESWARFWTRRRTSAAKNRSGSAPVTQDGATL